MTWFLFAQYGTEPLLAFIARRPLAEMGPGSRDQLPDAPAAWWRGAQDDFKHELDWLHAKGDQLVEYVALPMLQLVAVALNFGTMLVASRPAFNLPFRTMKDVTETRDILATFQLRAAALSPEMAPHRQRSERPGAAVALLDSDRPICAADGLQSLTAAPSVRGAGRGLWRGWSGTIAPPSAEGQEIADAGRFHASAPALERRPSGSPSRALDPAHAGQACASTRRARSSCPDGGDAILIEGQAPYPVPFLDLRAGRTNETWQPFGVTVDDTAGVGPPEQRLREQDMDGLLAEVLFPNMQVGPAPLAQHGRRGRLPRGRARLQRLAGRGVLPGLARPADRARRHPVDQPRRRRSPSSSTARGSGSRASTSACSPAASRIRRRRTIGSGPPPSTCGCR